MTTKLVREGTDEYRPLRIGGATDAYRLMKGLMDSDKERFYSLHLDGRNNLVRCEEVSVGSTYVVVHPKEIFKSALLSSCSSLILVHNHPSGDPTPSPQDLGMTKKSTSAASFSGSSWSTAS